MKAGGVIFIHLGVPKVHGELLRKCRAIWKIAQTIFQIALQIFIPLGALLAHGELLRDNSFHAERPGRRTNRDRWHK